MLEAEVTIIGAGVVGLAVAERLSKRSKSIVVLEKHERYGMETSSRNSEVIHAGIYYPPESLKTKLCVKGRDELYSLCDKYGIAHRKITKIITATDETELQKLEQIYQNGLKNGVELKMLDRKETLALEPHINTVGSIFSPMTGVISVHELMDYYFHRAVNQGVTVQFRAEVVAIERHASHYVVTIREGTDTSTFTTEKIVNAAGLESDTIAEMMGIDVDSAGYRLSYAKGSYFSVRPSASHYVSRLIYPAPRNEGLGVHALLDWGGRLKFGPDVEYISRDQADYSVAESKRKAFGEAIRRIVPAITDEDIEPDMSGIRPKLQKKGEAVRDFVITDEKERGLEGFVNLIGIESPGLTASPAIARYVESLLFG